MESKVIMGIVFTVLLIGMLTLAFNIQPVEADPKTIYVNDDNTAGPWDGTPEHPYQNITSALDHASVNDTIYVYNGTYYENVVVNNSVALIGENRNNTIIDGGHGTGFHVISDNINISGFTIRNCGPPEGGRFGGIRLDSCDNCKIYGNILNDNYVGIWPDSSSNNAIFNNTLSNCGYAIGFPEMKGNNQNIFDNFMSNNSFGIYLYDSTNSIVSNNTIVNSRKLSIYLQFCSNILLTNNNMTGNIYGLQVFGLSLSDFIHDIDASNTVDGKPIYYLINQRDLIIDPLTFPDIGFLGLVNSTNIIIKNLNLTKSGQGLLLAYTTRSTVTHLNVSFNLFGIDMFSSSENIITDNEITSNRYDGIKLNDNCYSNTIVNNTISNNGVSISMGWSDSNIIRGNTLSKNDYGIFLYLCHGNTIYHNNFINNVEQVSLLQSVNTWGNGYPSGGNYWSDYTDVDLFSGPYQNETGGDGIGDSPYIIDENNQDNYPLMNPYDPSIINFRVLYYDLLERYNELLNNFNALNSTYYELLDSYDKLLADFGALNATYYGLLADYNDLNLTYHTLLSNYSELQGNYDSLQTSYDNLQASYNALNLTYYGLLTDYNDLVSDYDNLQSSHDQLQGQYNSLNSSYTALQDSYDELQSDQEAIKDELSTIRNLMYIFIAATIIFIATTVYLAIRKPKVKPELKAI